MHAWILQPNVSLIYCESRRKKIATMSTEGGSKENEPPSSSKDIIEPNLDALIKEKIEGLKEEIEGIGALNQALAEKEHQHSDEINEARQEFINACKDGWGGDVLGIKRMGELDIKPFQVACYGKYFPSDVAEEECTKLFSLWVGYLGDPEWRPFKIVDNDGVPQEMIDEEDEKLKKLKYDFGDEVLGTVSKALMELNEYNPTGRCVVEELWNFEKGRKATLEEAMALLGQDF